MKGFFPLTTTLLLLFQTAAAIEYTSTSQALPHEEPKDHYPDCSHWAKEGHCVFGHTRSDFMMNWCTKSCVEALELKPAEVRYLKENEQIFFDLEATNVYGDVLDFERFEGYVTVVVNAARDCYNSDVFYQVLEHYRSIYPYTVEILLFPFDHPDTQQGYEECPETIEESEHKKRHVHIMKPVQFTGSKAHPLYKMLTKVFDIEKFSLKKPYYFFINPDGNVIEMHQGAGLQNLKDYISRHAKTDL